MVRVRDNGWVFVLENVSVLEFWVVNLDVCVYAWSLGVCARVCEFKSERERPWMNLLLSIQLGWINWILEFFPRKIFLFGPFKNAQKKICAELKKNPDDSLNFETVSNSSSEKWLNLTRCSFFASKIPTSFLGQSNWVLLWSSGYN